MARRRSPGQWPLLRQLRGEDSLGRGAAVKSRATAQLRPRTVDADRVVKSVCPYCAVGCAQNVFVKDGKVMQIEGDPDAPHSRGRLCPKGSATLQLTTGDARERFVLYRPPHGTDWERLDLETAMDMVADKFVAEPRRGLAVGERRPAHAAQHGHRRARRSDARQRGELPDQEVPHGGWGSSRSRTRRASATARPSSAWARPSGAAPRARCPATCRTPT